jgi:tetratricopeptide (TPR) repeat protein
MTERLQDNWATEARLLGAVLYRNGRWHEALRQYKEAAKLGRLRAWDWLFLAMTHHRLGHGEEARECLDKAKRWIAEANQHRIGWSTAWGWWGERIEVEELTREAETLVNSKTDR